MKPVRAWAIVSKRGTLAGDPTGAGDCMGPLSCGFTGIQAQIYSTKSLAQHYARDNERVVRVRIMEIKS